ncbi:hypothetical protein EON64_11780, partial [archaeon]
MFQVGAMIGVEVVNNGQPNMGGGQIHGKVYLQVDKEKVSALSLVLRFVGRELTLVAYESGEDSCNAYDSTDIVRVEANLAQFPTGEVTKGHFEFPFALVIPPNVPGSQGQVVGLNYFAIQYLLEAELVRPASMMNAKVLNGVEVLIMDPPVMEAPPVPSNVPPHILPVVSCSCFGTGHMQITALAGNTCLAMGEAFNLDYGVQNMSSSTVKGVDVMLVQVVRGRAKAHSFCLPTYIHRQRIIDDDVPSAQTKQKSQGCQRVPGQNGAPLLKKLIIKVPLCRPTYTGRIGSVTHMLIVQAITPTCTANPLIEVPMRIFSSRARAMFQNMVPTMEVPFQYPDDWQAQNMSGPMTFAAEIGMPAPGPAQCAFFAGNAQISQASPTQTLEVNVHSVHFLLQQLQGSNQFLEVSIVR